MSGNAFAKLQEPDAEVSIPYPRHLEEAALPQGQGIVAAVKKLFGKP